MAYQSALQISDITRSRLRVSLKSRGWTWTSGGAAFGLCGGVISPVIGSALTGISWFTGLTWHGLPLQRFGTVLLFLTIPLLIFGAHCLDLIDKQNDKASQARINQSSTNHVETEN